MRLYNTLSRQLEEITPQHAPEVTIYTCGPTVYDYPHVGNWFTYIREDILIRTLKLSGLQPKWVMNITDVGHLTSDADEGEDKLEKGAKREGKTAWDIASFYTDYFEDGMKRLNMLPPDYLPKATEHITEQIELIQKLEAKDFTYTTSDGIYYDTSRFPRYADFAKLDLDEQQAGARVEVNKEKRNPTDFALWKFSPAEYKRDMEWESPWGKGFPGWHVECSAMSMKYLGDTLDIHAGGIDHVPVHHTNEIAQSEAVTGKPFANMWMHSNHITINDEKVSKSLGNGITLEDIEAKGISLEALRLHVLESHYRSQSKFSWDSLEAAQNRLKVFTNFAELKWNISREELTPAFGSSVFSIDDSIEFLFEDLNSPLALMTLQAQVDIIYNMAVKEKFGLPKIDLRNFNLMLEEIDGLFGLSLSKTKDITESQRRIITLREESRKTKDWTKSDELRDELLEQGIGVRDTAQGSIWYRT